MNHGDSQRQRLVRTFGDFIIDKELWKGAHSSVYLARDPWDQSPLALKVLHARNGMSADDQRRNSAREALLLRKIQHPGIVELRKHGVVNGVPYLSFPYLSGAGLDQLVKTEPLPSLDAARLIVKVARAIQHAHSKGVFHRDLKPRNIFVLEGSREPVVLDWGLSWCKGDTADKGVQNIVGTPAYMSPEQARGEEERLTAATDVYGLGATFYFAVTARPPFEAPSSWKTLQMVMGLPPQPPQTLTPTLDARLQQVILTALEKEPGSRYPTAAAFADDIERVLDNRSPRGPSSFLGRLLG